MPTNLQCDLWTGIRVINTCDQYSHRVSGAYDRISSGRRYNTIHFQSDRNRRWNLIPPNNSERYAWIHPDERKYQESRGNYAAEDYE